MAKIVLGLGSSHSPMLSTPWEEWTTGHAAQDRRGYADVFEGRSKEREAWIGKELTPEVWGNRHAAVQKAIGSLSETFAQVSPDVVVIVGDDQREVFKDDGTPAMAIYWGDSLTTVPPNMESLQDFRRSSKWAEFGDGPVTYACEPSLARHMVEFLVDEEFDIAQLKEMPSGRQVGHAFNFVCRRVMHPNLKPYVPLMLNVFYRVNQPKLGRCYALGRALRRAIEAWESDSRVAIVASGGLSHTIIDEELDRAILAAMQEKDAAAITGWPEDRFYWPGRFGFGTGETKSWVTVAGAMEETDLQMELVDYIPLYRTTAGTGVGAAFAQWV